MDRDQLTSTARIEGFSDGVFAIVITIMVLEFRVPEHAFEAGLWQGVAAAIAPKLLTYALSFVVLTNLWIGHHALMHSAHQATPVLMWTNNNLLFWISLVPFATMLFGEHVLAPNAVALYAASLAMTSLSFTLLRLRVVRENKFAGKTLLAQRAGLRRSLISNSIYVAAIPTAYISVYASFGLFVASPIMFLVWHVQLTRQMLGKRVPKAA
jgi:uncharacterized membrane protein